MTSQKEPIFIHMGLDHQGIAPKNGTLISYRCFSCRGIVTRKQENRETRYFMFCPKCAKRILKIT